MGAYSLVGRFASSLSALSKSTIFLNQFLFSGGSLTDFSGVTGASSGVVLGARSNAFSRSGRGVFRKREWPEILPAREDMCEVLLR